MNRELIYHQAFDQWSPTWNNIGHKGSDGNNPHLQRKDYQQIQVYYDLNHRYDKKSLGFPSHTFSPRWKVKHKDKDWDYYYVS